MQNTVPTIMRSFPGNRALEMLAKEDGSFPFDPILQHRPNFAQSLPIQILVLGVTLALAVVLLIHLIFTAQYHWPLAPVNFVLQVSAVTTMLISIIATMHVVLSSTVDQSMHWPYMLDYINVAFPPSTDARDNSEWSIGELIAWMLMKATTSGLIQITHIQFLTLLFPSGLERRLILWLLGPFAIVSSIMYVVRIGTDQKLVNAASVVQNVCNATLSLLFTASLLMWGCLVNRRAAWRTDGGTAAFGAGAITLALLSTALTFVYIPTRDQYVWMPALMWSVILWQSFLGWWWWVGAGMGVGEVEDRIRREEKRAAKRRQRLAEREIRRERAQTLWKGVRGAFRPGQRPPSSGSSDESVREQAESLTGDQRPDTPSSTARSMAAGTAARSTPATSRFAWWTVHDWYLRLRHAHITAAQEQAVEHVERIHQAYGREMQLEAAVVGAPPGSSGRTTLGWGLGSFGIRRYRRSAASSRARGVHEGKQNGEEIEMEEHEEPAKPTDLHQRRARPRIRPGPYGDESRPSSMWWWGPLPRWRLQDTTDYS